MRFEFQPMQAKITDHMGDDLKVINAAKKSFGAKPAEWADADTKTLHQRHVDLLYFLARGMPREEFSDIVDFVMSCNSPSSVADMLERYKAIEPHDTPFNHCALSAEILVPIPVARQLVKHEYLIWSEISRRYKDDDWQFWHPGLGDDCFWRAQAENKKQGSGADLPDWQQQGLTSDLQWHTTRSFDMFASALKRGAAMEQARLFLPLNTMVSVNWTGTLGAFAKMLRLRLGPDAQAETRAVGRMIHEAARPLFPYSLAALLRAI